MKYHFLKTWPEYFKSIVNGQKTFEYRKNDRNFKQGDVLVLAEWNPSTGYTQQSVCKEVGFILQSGEFDLPEGFAIMSLLPYRWDEICEHLFKENIK